MLHDVWYALRRLRARPWHTAIVVAIFAVGYRRGADRLSHRRRGAAPRASLSRRRAARRAWRCTIRSRRRSILPFSDVGYRALEHRSHAFDVVASYRVVGVNLTVGHDTPDRVVSARVTGNFFDIAGLPAQRGRLFAARKEAAQGSRRSSC